VIKSFRSKALQRFWERGDESGIRADWRAKIILLLDYLDTTRSVEDLALVGSGFHPLKGGMSGRFAYTVSRNWRLTFSFDGTDVINVDLEDYHGR
jgi:proteic killer suppression protein